MHSCCHSLLTRNKLYFMWKPIDVWTPHWKFPCHALVLKSVLHIWLGCMSSSKQRTERERETGGGGEVRMSRPLRC